MIASDSEALNPGASSETWAACATGSTTELTAELPEQPLSAIARPVAATAQAKIADVGNHLPPMARNTTARVYRPSVSSHLRSCVSWRGCRAGRAAVARSPRDRSGNL